MTKLKPREWILILVPLLLVTIAATLQFRPQWNPFKPRFYVESAQAVELTPHEVARGLDAKWEVVLNHTWPRPKWWSRQNSWTTTTNPGDYIATKDGKKIVSRREIIVEEPRYDKKSDRYIATYQLSLVDVPRSSSELVLHGKVAVGMFETSTKPVSPVVVVRQVVRAANTMATVPLVSRANNLVPHKAWLTLRTAAQTRANGGYDTIVRLVFRRINNASFDQNNHTSEAIFVNEKGLSLSSVAIMQRNFRDARGEPDLKMKVAENNQYFFQQIELRFWTRPKNLRVVGYANLDAAWPVGFVSNLALPPSLIKATEPLTIEVPFQQRALKRGALFEYSNEKN